VGARVFGCDTCQEVCPHNQGQRAEIEPGTPYDTLPIWSSSSLEGLLELSREQFFGSPAKRCGVEGWLRNVIVAMGNSDEARYLPALQRMAEREDWVGEVAQRAVGRLVGRRGR
jgi:epoxyqueuosine reductase